VSKLNVLVLHKMGDPRYRREAVRSLEYMIPECKPDLNCIVHDADIPFPEYLKDINYHLIVLGPTFLCSRYNPRLLKSVKRQYKFIRDSDACKIALPQDDYDCSGILDDWMQDWNVSCIYTVCPNHWTVLYPNSSRNTEIRLGYTGYISNELIETWDHPKRRSDRSIDVSYRSSKLPANFGRIGELKWKIAERFRSAVDSRANLNLDISVGSSDFLPGVEWFKFLENSRFCLTTPSGSSLLDPRNEIRRCVRGYTALKRNPSYEEIEKHCFPGLDGRYIFTAVSPRNLEAALAETVQIATPGIYSGLMFPGEHYILLDENCGNIDDVLRMMADESLCTKLSMQCKESVLSEPRLRRKNIVNELISFAENHVSRKNIVVSNQERVDRVFARYNSVEEIVSRRYWSQQRVIQNVKLVAMHFGAIRVRDLIFLLSR
jgi:hypothetical protein